MGIPCVFCTSVGFCLHFRFVKNIQIYFENGCLAQIALAGLTLAFSVLAGKIVKTCMGHALANLRKGKQYQFVIVAALHFPSIILLAYATKINAF